MKQKNAEIFDRIKFAEAQHIGYGGQRQTLEDRSAAKTINSAGGLKLFVGIVADGIGGASAGEAAGQLTIDTILKSIQDSEETDPSLVLHNSIQAAHIAVRNAAKSNVMLRSMGTTATVAACVDGKLYLAHIGDSRAYLVRSGKLTQLTSDHTWGNEKVREGLLTLEQAIRHPRKDELARYVGQSNIQTLSVDVGLRLDGEVDPSKSTLVKGGLTLEAGDVVLLCTDGLVKERPNSREHFVEPDEIVSWVQRSEPQDAVNTLVSLALGRQVDDNVSVVMMEVPGKRKSLFVMPAAGKRSLLNTAALAVVLGLVVVLLAILVLSMIGSKGNGAAVTPLGGVSTVSVPEVERGMARVMEGAINFQVKGKNSEIAGLGDDAPIGEDVRIWTNAEPARLALEDGSLIVVGPFTTVVLENPSNAQTGAPAPVNVLMERGKVFVVMGSPWIMSKDQAFKVWANGARLGVNYDPTQKVFEVDCFGPAGVCLTQGPGGTVELQAGSRLTYQNNAPGELQGADHERWRELAKADLPPPTATPLPTETPIPTITPTEQPIKPAPAATGTSTTKQDQDGGGVPGGDGGKGGDGGGGG